MELETALEDLAPRLLRYSLGRVGEQSIAEEVAQEALTALVSRWRRHGPPASPEAFVFGIARRRAGRAAWRRRLARPLEGLATRQDSRPGPEAETAGRVELGAVRRALCKLPRRDREVLLLVGAAEVPLAEAAAILGISRPAAKMRLHRARRRLAALLEERDETRRAKGPIAESP